MSQQVNVYRELKFTDTGAKATFGTSGTPLIRTFDGAKALQIYTTCASTDTGTSYEPQLINNILTGAGQVGGRFRVNMETNVALGGWANAFKASVDCKTNGRATGLLSVVCAEMVFPASTIGAGTTAIYEAEIVMPANFVGSGQPISVFYIATSGSKKTEFDDNGLLFDISGVASGSSSFWYDKGSGLTGTMGEYLKIKTPGGTRYLGVWDTLT